MDALACFINNANSAINPTHEPRPPQVRETNGQLEEIGDRRTQGHILHGCFLPTLRCAHRSPAFHPFKDPPASTKTHKKHAQKT